MRKCTVISLFPLPIRENKPAIYPGYFEVPPCLGEDPEILLVDQSIYFVYVDDVRGSIRIFCPPTEMARSVVDDWVRSQPEIDLYGGAAPGIFWVDDEPNGDLKAFFKKYAGEITKSRIAQRKWYEKLVKLADDDWNKYHSHKVISELQRIAATKLGLRRDWLLETPSQETKQCPACRTFIPGDSIICSNCRVVLNKEEFEKMAFASK